jgi:uncharacterized delta-60 repeat protein
MKQMYSCGKYVKLKILFRRKAALLALLGGVFMMTLVAGNMAQTPGELDASFAPALANYEAGGTVINTVAVQPDGKILAGGQFGVFGDKVLTCLARLNPDGTIDTTFKPVIIGTVWKVVVQSDGKILVGGAFFSVNGVNRTGLARLNPDGSLDTGFIPAISASVNTIALQPDGKILIDSFVVTFPTGSQTRILRLNANGSADSSFSANFSSPGFTASIKTIAVQADGKILAGGIFRAVNSVQRYNFTRLNADGSLDPTFAFSPDLTAGNPLVIRQQPDGKILVGGTFTVFNGVNRNGIARLNADGTTDAGFEPGSSGFVSDIFLQSDGKILLAGGVANGIVRLNTDGSPDAGFNAGANPLGQNARVITVQADGRILTGSTVSGAASPVLFLKIARLNSNGAQEAAFQFVIGDYGNAEAILVQPDGKILICGRIYAVGGIAQRAIARLNVDGSLDTSFVPPLIHIDLESGFANALALQPDGKILVGGSFTNSIGNVSGVIRLNADGSLDNSFSTGSGLGGNFFDIAIRAIAVAPDGKIYAGGRFTTYDGVTRGSFVRLNSDGTVDNTFTMQATANSLVLDIEVQPDGKALAAGAVTSSGSNFNSQITRFNPNNTVDTTFNFSAGTGSIIKSFALQPDGKVIVSEFNKVSRLNPNGSVDTTFATVQFSSSVNAIVIQRNGKAVIGGDFDRINNTIPRLGLARLNPDGTVDPDFAPSAGTSGVIETLALQADGKILLGGNFNTINGAARTGFARLFGDAIVIARIRFDFDGDGRADLSIFRPAASAEWYWLNSSNNESNGLQFGIGADKPVPADYDGDGKSDVSVFRDGDWYRLNSSDNSFIAVHFGQAGDIPVPADYEGDGRADLAVYRQGNWYISNSSDNSFRAAQFGIDSDKPLIGDFDGDGKSDLTVYRPSNGTWYWINSSNEAFSPNQFGTAEDKPVPADYDGDGKTDLAVYRPSAGDWYIIYSGNSSFIGIHFGVTEDKPAPADYDGDGKADLAVYRDGIWYLLQSTAGFAATQFGAASDRPIPNAFVP